MSQIFFQVLEYTFLDHFYPHLHVIPHQKYTVDGYAHYCQLEMDCHL